MSDKHFNVAPDRADGHLAGEIAKMPGQCFETLGCAAAADTVGQLQRAVARLDVKRDRAKLFPETSASTLQNRSVTIGTISSGATTPRKVPTHRPHPCLTHRRLRPAY